MYDTMVTPIKNQNWKPTICITVYVSIQMVSFSWMSASLVCLTSKTDSIAWFLNQRYPVFPGTSNRFDFQNRCYAALENRNSQICCFQFNFKQRKFWICLLYFCFFSFFFNSQLLSIKQFALKKSSSPFENLATDCREDTAAADGWCIDLYFFLSRC